MKHRMTMNDYSEYYYLMMNNKDEKLSNGWVMDGVTLAVIVIYDRG